MVLLHVDCFIVSSCNEYREKFVWKLPCDQKKVKRKATKNMEIVTLYLIMVYIDAIYQQLWEQILWKSKREI